MRAIATRNKPKCRARNSSSAVKLFAEPAINCKKLGKVVRMNANIEIKEAEIHDQMDRELSDMEVEVIIHNVNPGLATHSMHQPELQVVADDDLNDYFRWVHSRRLSTLNITYLLPVDQEEAKVL